MKDKTKNILEYRKISLWFWDRKRFLKQDTQKSIHWKQIDKNFAKIKDFGASKYILRE